MLKGGNLLITFVGINGSGKSTILSQVYELVNQDEEIAGKFERIMKVKFPCNARYNMYDLIKNKNPRINQEMALDRYLYFYNSYRDDLSVLNRILLFSDRYMSCNFAFGTNGTLEELKEMENMEYTMLDNPRPFLEFLIDVPAYVARSRMLARGNELRTNDENYRLQHKARESYLVAAKANSNFTYVIDNSTGTSLSKAIGIYQIIKTKMEAITNV